MATVGGVTHRLTWADRNAGWRQKCSCGWIDSKIHWTERNALLEGNRHVLGARRSAARAARQERKAARNQSPPAGPFASTNPKGGSKAVTSTTVQLTQAKVSPAPGPWKPRPGWGTVRSYVEVSNDQGGKDVAFRFVPDDGSPPQPMVSHKVMPEMGEYARGVWTADGLTIKVPPSGMVEAEQLFETINAMEAGKRVHMYMSGNKAADDCGWTWTSDYKLVRAAPGLE